MYVKPDAGQKYDFETDVAVEQIEERLAEGESTIK